MKPLGWRRTRSGLVVPIYPVSGASPDVAFDAFTGSVDVADPTDISFTHTPVGTPRGVIVFARGVSPADGTAGATYGGTAMTEVTGSPKFKSSGEWGSLACWFLGSSVPTGPQTVAVDLEDVDGRVWRAGCITLTAGGDTEVVDTDASVGGDVVANPSATLSLGGRVCFCAMAFYSGHDVTTSVTPLTNWTSRNLRDHGTVLSGINTYDIIGSTDVTAGWTQTTEDAVMLAIAVAEVAAAGVIIPNVLGMGIGVAAGGGSAWAL